jgi:hypothetical protein
MIKKNCFKAFVLLIVLSFFQELKASAIKVINVNLMQHPSLQNECFYNNYTLPDLHGNTLKLLNALVATGLISIAPHDYKKFRMCYYKTKETPELLADIRQIISNLSTLKKRVTLRLIGDEFSDRGQNDYYTLLLLEKIIQSGIQCEFILSNHGFEFIEGYEKLTYFPKHLPAEFACSLENMSKLLKKNLVSHKEVQNLINRYYKPYLKILSYILSKDLKTIIIFSHAPVGLNHIKKLAKQFSTVYDDRTASDLAMTIDKINDIFQNEFVVKNKVHTLFDILNDFMWNRDYSGLNRPKTQKGYSLQFVHGHDSGEKSSGNIYNIDFDNNLGKSIFDRQGKHQIFIFNEN